MGETVSSAAGEAVSSAAGETVSSAAGEAVSSAAGEAVSYAVCKTVSSAAGETVSSAAGESVSSAAVGRGEIVPCAVGESETVSSAVLRLYRLKCETVPSEVGGCENVFSAEGETGSYAAGEKQAVLCSG
ncbi:hypothetical protein NDU88_000577 [Pleurodeles waltl]|uniref:Uncharacterized protein n=1 Tax=Pleurodeles waltl TaxID=8319 RepID=A0AAV7M2U5_PLEWA|nr:hypothetical protein NDU88_000577 [Pleurodeles waltl]